MTITEARPSDPVRSVMTRVVATVPVWQPLRDVARELAADEVPSEAGRAAPPSPRPGGDPMGSDRTPVPARDRLPCRLTDRVEDAVAWLLTAAALILVVAAGIIGSAVHNRQVERAEVESATRWPMSAVLLEDASLVIGGSGERIPVQVAARWTDRTGAVHTGMVTTRTATAVGSAVEVWLDEEGRVVDQPIQPLGTVLAGVGAAGGVLAIGGALLYLLWAAVRSLAAAANDRRWEREWAHVEPEWRSWHFR